MAGSGITAARFADKRILPLRRHQHSRIICREGFLSLLQLLQGRTNRAGNDQRRTDGGKQVYISRRETLRLQPVTESGESDGKKRHQGNRR